MVNVVFGYEGGIEGMAADWAMDELEEEALSTVSLWEAEVAALSDELIASMQDAGEDEGIG
jgi:hypothetical protein